MASEIARASRQFQQELEEKKRIIVGVNEYVEDGEELEIPTLYIDDSSSAAATTINTFKDALGVSA